MEETFTRAGFRIDWPPDADDGAAVRWMTLDRDDITDELQDTYATTLRHQMNATSPSLRIWHAVLAERADRLDERLSPALLANGISHMRALEAIAEGPSCDGLIFEDDVTLHPRFLDALDAYRDQLPASYGMLFVGDAFHDRPDFNPWNPVPWINVYPRSTTRTADAYLVSKGAAQAIVSHFKAMALPIDWHYNIAAEFLRLGIYWAYPPIASQATVNGRIEKSYSALR